MSGQIIDFYDYVSTRPYVPVDPEQHDPCEVIDLPVIRIERNIQKHEHQDSSSTTICDR